jgi:hypothetical protein
MSAELEVGGTENEEACIRPTAKNGHERSLFNSRAIFCISGANIQKCWGN